MEDRGARAASGPRSAGRKDQEGRRRRLVAIAGRGSARWEPIGTLTSASRANSRTPLRPRPSPPSRSRSASTTSAPRRSRPSQRLPRRHQGSGAAEPEQPDARPSLRPACAAVADCPEPLAACDAAHTKLRRRGSVVFTVRSTGRDHRRSMGCAASASGSEWQPQPPSGSAESGVVEPCSGAILSSQCCAARR